MADVNVFIGVAKDSAALTSMRVGEGVSVAVPMSMADTVPMTAAS